MSDSLAAAFPGIDEQLPKLSIATLPTPVSVRSVSLGPVGVDIAVKHDDVTSTLYGGNKVRKLEYLLRRAADRGARRVATFGAAGSNHALATAIHAHEIGLDCTCFLSHQKTTPNVARTLNMHRQLGTEIVRWGGGVDQVALFREHLQGRGVWVVPLGGTCWLGAVGFVNAAFELARQIEEGLLPGPDRIYIACGTTGSAAGLALGLAAAGIRTTVHAVQVADNPFASEWKLHRLMAKTHDLLNRIEPAFVADGWRDGIVWRDEFLAGGYARVDDATTTAVAVARDELGLTLETTYTGKAFAAMFRDLHQPDYDGAPYLFWNTYNSAPLPASADRPASLANIPQAFEGYFSR
jgi:D-cysteine desulfhydrase